MVHNFETGRDKFYSGALLISFLVGIAFRIYHLFIIGFDVPFNLGGLFYQMSLEIIQNGFALPATIPYYFPGGLPFAYPPIPFYVQAIIIKIFSPELFVTVNLLPPVISVFSLIAFYFLAQKAIKENVGVIAAFFTFSIIPIAFTEQIEAMGLSEAFGTLTLVLYTYALLWAKDRRQKLAWIFPGIMLGICVMSSPGSIYASILISIFFLGVAIFGFLKNKDSYFFIGTFIVGVAGILVSSPYWFTVISNHGLAIFTNPFTAQNTQLITELLKNAWLFRFIYASPFWNALFLFGLLSAFIKKHYLILFFSIVLMPIPRENWIMSIPASLIIGIGIVYLFDLLGRIPGINPNFVKVALIWTMILFFGFDSRFNLLFRINDDTYRISETQINDLVKMRASNLIPADQYVAAVGNWGLIEWSPALLKRTVINNLFGLEWLPEKNKKNLALSEKLPEYTSPGEVFKSIQEDFQDLNRIYLVADMEYLDQLYDSGNNPRVKFDVLERYDNLGLALVEPR